MVKKYIELILQLVSIGLVIAAAGLWAGAGGDMRPKFRDEQTLVGGTIWSQIIIPIGILISKIVDEDVDAYMVGFYILSGFVLLLITAAVLVLHQIRIQRRRRHRQATNNPSTTPSPIMKTRAMIEKSDRAYYVIGIICFIAALFKMAEFIVFIVGRILT